MSRQFSLSSILAFSVIEDAPITQISPDYFFRIFEDHADGERLAREMDLYFFDRIEFFPSVERSQHHVNLHQFIPKRGRKYDKYGHDARLRGEKKPVSDHARATETASLSEKEPAPPSSLPPVAPEGGHHGDEPRERMVRPKRFFEIETELIERRFPADADIRAHLKTLRSYFCHNLIRYLIYKRLILLVAIGVFWLLAFSYNGLLATFVGTFFPAFFSAVRHSQVLAVSMRVGFVVFSFLAAILTDLALNSVLFDRFKHAIEQSCFHVSTVAISRTERLRNCFDNCLKRIDEEQRQRTFNPDLADRAGRWIVIVYWLAKRLENFERFALIELWRIRRINFWINLAVRLATFIGAALLLFQLAIWIIEARNGGEIEFSDGLVAVFILTIVLVMVNYVTWKSSVRLVRDSMKTQSWARFADVEIQEEFRHQIYKDKSEIVRWYAQFQGLVSGSH